MSEQVGISPHDNKDVSIYQKQHLQIGAHTQKISDIQKKESLSNESHFHNIQ